MQFDVNIRLYEYWHEQVKIRKKRWNNKEINKFVNRKLEKGGWSVATSACDLNDINWKKKQNKKHIALLRKSTF